MTTYAFENIAIVSTEKKKPVEEDKFNYIGLEHLSPDTFEVVDYGSEVAPKGDKLVMKKGDVLFGKRRAYQKKVGIAPCDGIFSAHGMVLRPNTEVVDARFFPFFIKSDCFLDEAIRVSVGSLSPTVNWRDLKVLEFDLPSLEKQAELAEILWAAEDLKTKYRNLLVSNDDLVKSRFIEMFGDPRFQKEGLTRLGEHIDLINGFAFKGENFCDEGVPVIKIKNVNSADFGKTSLQFHPYDPSLDRFIVKPGELLMSLTGTVGKDDFGRVCLADETFSEYYLNQRNAKLQTHEELNPVYLLHLLRNEYIHECVIKSGTGVRQCHLHNNNLADIAFLMPTIEKQSEFAAFAEQVDKSGFALKQAIVDLGSMMSALLNEELGLGNV